MEFEGNHSKKQNSFRVTQREHSASKKGMHFHPAYQISLILAGRGRLAIGNQMKELRPGSLFLLGPDLPHELITDESIPTANLDLISIYFLPEAFGAEFFKLPEMHEVSKMLERSRAGILWQVPQAFKKRMFKLRRVHKLQRFIQFLALLNKLSGESDYEQVCKPIFVHENSSQDSSFSKILQYISQNFDQPISLEEMAELANLNKYSFCRYFKKMTQMSFVSYLNEFRISKACRFLSYDSYNVSQIGYLVGFNTLSNFYRQFQKIMDCTPSEYREESMA